MREGRYGPYVNHGKINATLPKGKDPMAVTLDEALALIAEKGGKAPAGKAKSAKASKGGAKSAKGAAKPAAKKSAKAAQPAAGGKG